jgi:uncharacterized protein (TIGR00288 family)
LNLQDERLQIAVFIDFDNIEIGVKTTLHNELDLALVLDALREKGEVVAKSAYGDWGRAGNHSRTLTEHGVHMVQRNVTPRGDKNGGDINLVVDALEMAFTRPHINTFAIVGGDSDFMSLVEKLKQFGKRVVVVGGRSFTSGILQRNCHEFISYENLLSGGKRSRRSSGGGGSARLSLKEGFRKVQRALKVLADRGVQPQLGPLKSTLLQLDPTFSERDYGTSSFRDFIQKLCNGYPIEMTQTDQGYLVTSTGEDDGSGDDSVDEAETTVEEGTRPAEEAMELLRKAVASLQGSRPGKPTYVRHMAQALRGVEAEFDEQRFGFRTLTELMHQGEREGIVKMIRDRQGAWRVSPATGSFDGEGSAPAEDEAPAAASVETSPAAADPGLAEEEIVAAAVAELGAESGGDEDAEAKEAKSSAAKKKSSKKKAAAKKKTAAKAGSAKKKTAAKTRSTKKKSTAKKTTTARAKAAAAESALE